VTNMHKGPATLVEALQRSAEEVPDGCYTFLPDGETTEVHLTFAKLHQRATAIAEELAGRYAPGERLLLLYPPGLDFIVGLLGCICAGMVAVPTYPPDPARLGRTLPRLLGILKDARPRAALTTGAVADMAQPLAAMAPELHALQLVPTDSIDGQAAARGHADADPWAVCLIQYTSGSIGSPKGVLLTHRNLLANLAMISHSGAIGRGDRLVSWLPQYHDMGLLGGILTPLYNAIPHVLLPPQAFLQRPIRWLQALTRYRGTLAMGPDFSYELCVRKVTAEEVSRLDLSRLRVVWDGAEPVRAEVIDRFSAKFEPAGFRREAFYPCYGMAEASLIVSGGSVGAAPVIRAFRASALEENQAEPVAEAEEGGRRLVGCGRALLDERIVIAEPETATPCPHGRVGEIWIAGPNVGLGYHDRPEETAATFQARLATGEGPFLRSGDLGFLDEGELFVTGRRKDLLIVRGSNHYPQDIEETVQRLHPALRPGCGAAFTVEVDGQERLAVVQELAEGQQVDPAALLAAIRQAISDRHDLQIQAIRLIESRTIHKTSSGKIQRHATRADFLAGRLEVIAAWDLPSGGRDDQGPATTAEGLAPPPHGGRSAAEIQAFLMERIAQLARIEPEQIDVTAPIASYGLDSLLVLELMADAEDWLGRPIPSTLPWSHPTIERIARHLGSVQAATGTPR
jgi:acyl-CoA synthetase (AMP-forming)/AMP-acid ligase II/acyl carrier protein